MLPALLESLSIPVLWAHFFYRHKAIPNAKIATRICDKLNNLTSLHHHAIVDSGITFNIVCSAIADYVKFYFKTLMLREKKKMFIKNTVNFD